MTGVQTCALPIWRPLRLVGVHVEPGAHAEIVGRVVGNPVPARTGVGGDEQEADRLEAQLGELELVETRRRLELTPGDATLRLSLGQTLLRQGKYDEAAAELQKAVVDPRQADAAHMALARCFQEKGFLDLARSEYEKALTAHPGVDETAREILYNLGLIAEAEGNSAEARSLYARIFEVDTGYKAVFAKMALLM